MHHIIISECTNDDLSFRRKKRKKKGNDVLLIYPCGAGKSRVIENAPIAVKLGFELRSGTIIKKKSFGFCM